MLTTKWETFSLYEQLGNIGVEVSRTRHWQGKDQEIFWKSVERTLELFNLTLDDPRWRSEPAWTASRRPFGQALSKAGNGRRREIIRAREVFCDAVLGGPVYRSSLDDLMNYLLPFAIAARQKV